MILTDYKKNKEAKFFTGLLWDVDLKNFDYFKAKHIVVERVVELGTLNDWYAILNMYGEKTVINEIKNIETLPSKDINFVHKFLKVPLEELLSYQNSLSGKKHWRE